jgi:hypothetical protein
MRISYVIALLGLSFLFASCQKDFELTNPIDSTTTTPTPGPNTGFLVKTYKEDVVSAFGNYSSTFILTYDASNRIKTMISTANPGDKFVYTYGSNSYVMEQYNSNVLSIHETFFLNSNNLVDSTFQYNNTRDTTTEKYIYDANKLLKELKQYEVSRGTTLTERTTLTHDSHGNVLTETSTNSPTVTYTYNTAQLETRRIGLIHFTTNKHLVQNSSTTISGMPASATHTYTFDSNNRITSEKQTSAIPGEVLTLSFTYY